MGSDLIDEYRLLTFPTILGTGERVFPAGGAPAELELVSAAQTRPHGLVAVPEGGAMTARSLSRYQAAANPGAFGRQGNKSHADMCGMAFAG